MSHVHVARNSSFAPGELEEKLANAERELSSIKQTVHSELDLEDVVGFALAPVRPLQVSSSSFQSVCRLVGEFSARIRCRRSLDGTDGQQAIDLIKEAQTEAKERVSITLQNYLLKATEFEETRSWRARATTPKLILDILSEYFSKEAAILIYKAEIAELEQKYPRQTLSDAEHSPVVSPADQLRQARSRFHATITEVLKLQTEASKSEENFKQLLGSEPTLSWTYKVTVQGGLIAECRKRGQLAAELEYLEKMEKLKTLEQRIKLIERREEDTEVSAIEHRREHDTWVEKYTSTDEEARVPILKNVVFSLAKYYTVDAIHEVFEKKIRALRMQQLGIPNTHIVATRKPHERASYVIATEEEEPATKKPRRIHRLFARKQERNQV